MEFGRYKEETLGLANEILEEFSEHEIDEIHFKLIALGFEAWLNWKSENLELIMQYVNATPSQRLKTKRYVKAMPLVAYAAYQHCLSGYEFICKAESLQYSIGSSYRNFAAESGLAFNYVQYHNEHELWPWGENDPFFNNESKGQPT